MQSTLRYTGLDVHKVNTVIAVAEGSGGEAKLWGRVSSESALIERELRKLGGPERVRVCYEAGPTGYGLARHLLAAGYACEVVAPTLVPSDTRRIKTDNRDAIRLAHFLRSGNLTAVAIPDAASEAIRDLVRARDAAKRAERVARHQLDKLLLRHGRIWTAGGNWTQAHRAWVQLQTFEFAALTATCDDAVAAVDLASQRVQNLTAAIGEVVSTWTMGPLVQAFQAFRGIQLVTAATVAAEVGDFARFPTPRHFMAYLGLVPSERSSGSTRRQGSITRTGNGHVRRVLVEAAWSYRMRPQLSKAIAARNEGVAAGVQAIAWKAQQRLHKRYRRLIARGKSKAEVVVAVARELAGFLWAAARQPQLLAAV
jgi:transposase